MIDIAGLAGTEGFSEEALELLQRMLQEEGVELPQEETIRPRADSADREAPPLALAQRRLWAFEQVTPGSAVYNLPTAVRLTGPLDVPALAAALREIVRRHETLRTTFGVTADGEPVQRIAPPAPLTLPRVDLSALPGPAAGAAVRGLLAAEARRPFDLERGPLLRQLLLAQRPQEHVLLLVLHHIVSDGWSMGVLVRELGALYDAFTRRLPSPLPELAVQYADFALWQRARLDGGLLDAEMDWWRERLRDVTPLELPTDRPRAAAQAFRGARRAFRLPAEVLHALESVSRRRGATLFMTLLAAFQALLARHAGLEDIAVGTPVAGREQVQTEGMIGFFVNTLVMRSDLAGDPDFLELLGRVKETALAAFSHQELPFERLVAELQPERDLSRTPLFQAMLVLQNAPMEPLRLPGLVLEPVEAASGTAKFDLTWTAWELGDHLEGGVEYDRGLFDGTTIERLLAQLGRLLEGFAAEPDVPFSAVPLLAEGEQHQLLVDWNDTAAPVAGGCIHGLFAEQARRTPDRVALVEGERQLSFAELDRRADRLARRLRHLGVTAESRVGVLLDRSLDALTAVLAALKAGGAYVPLDPAYPAERLAYVAGDSGAAVLVVRGGRPAGLPADLAVLDLDVVDHDRAESLPATSPDALAYVIYTSGSTGRPKGVMVQHRSVMNLLAALGESVYAGAGGPLRVAVNAPLAFDASVKQWIQLLCGHTLHLVAEDVRLDMERFLAELARHAVDVLDCTPGQLRHLVAAGLLQPGRTALSRVLVGGEAIPQALWEQLAASASPAFFNVYGPTECTVDTTAIALHGAPARPVLGRALANVRVHLLDARLHPVPLGAAGELSIGGAGVARGYLGRPALTAERFIPDPWADVPGARLYRSGDLGRFRADGTLELLGRIDHQVKVRGFRIELGEIETALARHPGVRAAVVMAREDGASLGGRRLVAYLVAGGETPTPAELRRHLLAGLPDYMVPSAFVFLESLPLTANGKVDRRALARLAPDLEAARPAEPFAAPSTAAEERLAAIWGRALGGREVGVHDNFFELGGDSIVAIQVVSQAAQAGLRLTVRQLFEHPTVAALAAMPQAATERPAAAGPASGPAPLTPLQQRFFERRLPRPEHFNQALLLEASPGLDPRLLESALAALTARHDALRLRFEKDGRSGWRQEVAAAVAPPAVPEIDLSALPGEQRAAALDAAATDLHASLDLGMPPLLRAALFRAGAEPARLLLTLHHLVVDGVSWRILLEELETLCSHLPLPPATTPFRLWAERLAGYAVSPAAEAQAAYWLDGEESRAAAAATTAAAGTVVVSLDAEETRRLLTEVPRAYRTRIEEVLLAALVQAVGTEGRLRVDLEGHGREELFDDVDLSRTVGWFTAVYPVLLDVGGAASPGAALRAVKEQLRAVPGRGVGFGLLRYLGRDEIRESLGALPAAGVVFNYLGQFDASFAAGGLFRPAGAAGETHSRLQPQSHPLQIDGGVTGGRLQMRWSFDASFDRATVEALAARFIAALRGLVEHCLAPLDRLAVGNIADLYPASPVQQGMLFHSLHAPESGVYVGQLAFDFAAAALDETAFERAWRRLLDRHPVLRTAFLWDGPEEPLQVVYAQVPLAWERRDWRGLPGAEREARLAAFLAEDRGRGFDLAQPPLMRLALLRLSDETCRFVWSHHHVLLDGWALAILLRELFTLYEAEARGEEPLLPPARPYRDFIAWLERQSREAAETFWRAALAGFTAPTPLGVDRAHAGETGLEPGQAFRTALLPPAVTGELSAFARRHRLTLNTLTQGAWALLLQRYGGAADMVFGVVSAGRSAPVAGIEEMVGLFINTLPARVVVEAGRDLAAWLRDLQERQAAMLQHEYTPLSRIQGWSEVPRGVPLFESLFVFESYPVDATVEERARALGLGGSQFLEQTNYPLTIEVQPGAGLGVKISYDTGRFDAATVARMLGHFEALLAAIAAGAANSGAAVETLAVLTPAERHQLLHEWNDSALEPPSFRPVHELFAARARRQPQATAAVFQGRRLSYGELDERSGRLARTLAAAGVGPDQVVPLVADRSLDFLTAMLGVFQAGGAYLPIDPLHPVQRQTQVIAASGARLVLAERRFAAALEETFGASGGPRLLVLEDLLDQPAPDCELPRARPEHLAYVIYTSGSTGVPKGAMLEHRGMLNHLWAKVEDLRLTAEDVIAQTASQCFDISVWQFLVGLLVGGSVQVFPDEVAHDPLRLLAEVEEGGVTLLETVPSLLQLAVHELEEWPERRPGLARLRWLIPTGEALPPELSRRWLRLYPAVPLVNAYGPTECSDDVTHHRIHDAPGPRETVTPIGRPVPNLRLYVLGPGLDVQPVGAAGELFVGGAGLGRGYLGDGGRTAEAWVPDPLSGEPGSRLYRTGDLARMRGDGALEFLGRIDHQVKVRGFRIELGEIEAVLARHPAVREAVVLARQDRPGETRLAAYLVPREETPDRRELVHFLEQRLPEYMVPSGFVTLPALPLLSNGKLDRRTLARIVLERAEPGADRMAPRTDAELRLAAVWREVLRLDEVSVHDNFFEMGGDSILSIQMVSRAGRAGLRLTPRQIFEHPTIAELAMVAATPQAPQDAIAAAEAADGPVPLTPIQGWFFEHEPVHPEHYNQAVFLEVGALQPAALHGAVAALMVHHDALRLRFSPTGGWSQVLAPAAAEVPATRIDLSALPPARRQPALEEAAGAVQTSLDLTAGPLLRAAAFDLGNVVEGEPDRLLLIAHHLVIDGVSWRILLEDLETAYRQIAAGETVALASRTTPFPQWARRLAAHAQTAEVAAAAQHWLERIDGFADRLPVDFGPEAGANDMASVRRVTVALSPEATRALLSEVPRVYRTRIDDVLLAALVEACGRWTGRRRLLVHLEGHGREDLFADLDISRTVGWFTALYPVLLDLGAAQGPGEALKTAKEQLRAVPGRGIPFGLARSLDGETGRRLRALPRPEVELNYLGQLDQALEAGSLFRPAAESAGAGTHGGQLRPHLLEVNGGVAGGRLQMAWSYSIHRHRPETVERLAQGFLEALEGLIAHCLSPAAGGWTPSDFPLAGLDIPALDRLLAGVPGEPGEVDDLYAASPLQQGMLFHTLSSPESGVYVEQVSLALRGDLDEAVFRATWQRLLDRHPILRTGFAWQQLAEPVQVVHRKAPLALRYEDWRDRPVSEQEAALDTYLREDRQRGFDLAAPPLLRLALFRLEATRYRFVWTFHHVLLDGWSMPILLRELFALYDADRQGSAVVPAGVPYREYIAWLRRQDLGAAEAFWRQWLAGFTAPTPLGVDRAAAPRDGGPAWGMAETYLSAEATEALRAFARHHRLTLNTLAQAAWALLLGRYSGQEDVVFGTVSSGRSVPVEGIEEMVGLFINTLPARVEVPAAAELGPWLHDLQERQAGMRHFEYSPLFRIQRWSEVPATQPLFESIVAFENYPIDASLQEQASWLEVEGSDVFEQTQYPVNVVMIPAARLHLKVLHDPRRLEPAAVARMLGHLEALLATLPGEPGRALADLPLLTDAERHQVLVEWNATRADELATGTLEALFEAQASAAPERPAVFFEERVLSYGELELRANRIARHLRRRGVASGVPVGVCLDRSDELVAALLGILKAGGIYIPLDPSYPRERLAVMTAGVPVLVTDSRLGADLPEDKEIVCLDLSRGEIERESGARPPGGPRPDSLAYVIFTSGSTGRPKGVVIDHQGAVNTLLDINDRFAVGPADRVLALSSLSFDLSVYDIFGLLAAGGAVVIPGADAHRDPEGWAGLARRHRVSIWNSVPALAEMFVDHVGGRPEVAPSALRLVMMSGDWIPVGLPDRIRALGEIEVVSLGGATEASIWSILYPIGRVEAGWASIPYGRPMRNQAFYVLNERLEPQPVGVPGPLFIGGIGVALGYWQDEQRTRASFLRDPFTGEFGGRLYRTGDLGRYLPDGNIEFLGRVDHQVKIRGYRIELGEIEAVLAGVPGVKEALVVVREDLGGGRGLQACVVPKTGAAGASLAVEALRERLAARLPDYMVPGQIVFLEAFPLTANGKVDRQALTRLAPVQEAPAESSGVPRTPFEELVAGLFAEVLRLDRVGVEDDFFELGGHSLVATQLTSRVRESFGVELPLRALFETPTAAALAAVLETRVRARDGVVLPPIQRVQRDGRPLPLSFSQQRLWFLDQLAPGSAVYNVPAAVRLRGPLHEAALAAAFTELVRRHESLRTAFRSVDGEPAQVVAPPMPFPLLGVDLRGLPEAARGGEALRLAGELARRPFDLTQAPLLRCCLALLGPEEHLLAVNLHHIVSDGWSMSVLVQDLGTLYDAFSRSLSSPLPELGIQYPDFAVWQRQWLSGETLEQEIAFWAGRIRGAATLELPTDRPRPAVQTFGGSWQPFALDGGLAERLRALSRRHGVTLFMTLLAGFQALLARYSGQDDVVVGTPIAGRGNLQTEPLIGFFVNTLPVRTDLSGDPETGELLARVREVTLATHAHQDLPFEKLVQELHLERDLSRPPVFQVVFTLQTTPFGPVRLPGFEAEMLPLDAGAAKFDLTLAFSETEEGIAGGMQYNRDLFEGATLRRMARHLEVLLAGAAAGRGEGGRLADLPLLTAEETAQLLGEWCDTGKECPQLPLVHELFAAHAARRPQAPAISSPAGGLTYGEVEARSNRLAHHLRSLGVGPDVLVAMCTDRTLERVVGIVAVLKAGGAYVSLDPTHPRERLAFLLEDARAPVILTQQAFLEVLPATDARVLCLDADWQSVQGDESTPPESGVTPDNLAYVVYTSGSTGKPKGVEIPHAGLMNLVRWHQDLYEVKPEDRGTQIASPAFDASIWELWPYLAAGASVHVPDEDTRLSSPGMIRWWAEQRITLAYLMTPLAEGVLEEEIPEGLELPTRALIIGGDRLHRGPSPGVGFRLMNHYGPAEYSVTCTVVEVPPEGEERGIPTIGRAIDNTRIYVLDREQRSVPVGVPGELYVAGIGLARGYLRRPDLTAAKFVPDPFAGEPGARMYRTADLVRWLPDGDIDFLGRLDHQVKIRGLRIELGEIESVLGQHPELREVAVLVREDRPGDKRLAAYLVAGGEMTPPSTDELRAYLKERLPEYMVPAGFLYMDALPLTPNGKVDRRALPPIDAAGDLPPYVAPQGRSEELLAAAFAQVLQLERVGAEDNFFDLGGHSLLATRLVSRVRTAAGVDLPVRAVFEAPTVAALAHVLERAVEDGDGVRVPPVEPVPRDRPLPLSFAQERLWFLDQLDPGSPVYNVPAAVLLQGRLDRPALGRAFAEIVRRHEVLRTTFHDGVEGYEAVQVVAPAGPLTLPLVDLAGLLGARRDAEARRLAREEAGRPFDLRRGPLARTALLALGKDEHHLLLTLHHAVSDAWSMDLLVAEVGAFYTATAAIAATLGRPASLPELPVQYADFAVWQRRWLTGGVLDAQLAYWRRRLAGGPPVLELPVDRQRPAVQTFHGDRARVDLGPAAGFEDLARREGATLFILMQAVFHVLLRRITGQTDIGVGTPVSGRHRPELEGLIGMFLNTVVVRLEQPGDPTFRELLREVRELVLEAFAHQDLPFERLVDELQPQRSLSHSPLFQAMFVLLQSSAAPDAAHGLRLSGLPAATATSKFDLTFSMPAGSGDLPLVVEYNTDLFDRSTVLRLAGGFRHLAESAAADPDLRLSRLPLLSEGERHQLLTEWNDAERAHPGGPGVHRLFEAQTEKTPDAVAAVFAGHALSYAELNRRANRLAHRLQALGVGPDVGVGLGVERSLEMAIGLLGIFKAGGAYVPLDPAYPRDRRAFMLRDAAVPVLLTQTSLVEELAEPGLTAICLDAGDDLAAWDDGDPMVDLSEDNLGYVIYTSGSTGRPKGVVLSHLALRNLIEWHLVTLLGGVQTLQFASLSFDASFHEMFACWGSGGTLHVLSEAVRRDTLALSRLLLEERVEKAILPVVVLQQLAEEYGGWKTLPPLLEITTTGEQLQTTRAMAELLVRLPGCAFHNHYGPSESHVATAYTLDADPARWATHPSIGLPISNSSIHLLDRHLAPVAVGVAGELYIGGVCLARGYLGRPDLTAERFVPDPLGSEPGARLYRTGDKVRRLPDGNLDFFGRFDHQVKIRGFRVELEEIESALGRHPGVRQTVVLAREDTPGDKRLVAYVVPEAGTGGVSEWRAFLDAMLPAYMVPSHFVPLESFPLTPNGKVDRGALPAPEGMRPDLATAYVAPRTAVEEALATLWSEVLRTERVGVHDDFFSLGGHSLLATRLTARVREALGVEVPVRAVFEVPTVAGLAARVEQRLRGEQAALPAIAPLPRGGDLPLSFAQQRLWFLDRLEPGGTAYNMAAPVRLRGVLDVAALRHAVGEIVRRHEVLRTTFGEVDGQPVQRIAPAGAFHLPVVDLGGLAEEARGREASRLADAAARRPFDLGRGPLMRETLMDLGGEHVVLFTVHHIVADGWSLGVLMREMSALYGAFSQGLPSPLPELPVQYADFAGWQQRWLAGETLAGDLAYWRYQLADLPVLELPADRPRPLLPSAAGASCGSAIPGALLAELRGFSRRRGTTVFMTLLAVFQTLLARHSGQRDFAVGTPVAGRDREGTQDLIGLFLNSLVLRADLSGDPSFDALLARVRRMTLGAFAHQDVPMQRLVEELAPERSLSVPPLFQTALDLIDVGGLRMDGLSLPGLEVLAPDLGSGVEAKLDLTLYAVETESELALRWVYGTALFDAVRIARLAGQFEALLRAGLAAPEQPAADLPLLGEAERQQLLVEWNDTARAVAARGLHERVGEQAARYPERVALISGETVLRYGELDLHARRVAGRLRALGVGPEVRVAVCVERSIAAVVSILGVLQAGGAYVPLDPELPPARLAGLVEDSGAAVLVTRSVFVDRVPGFAGAVLTLDGEEPSDVAAPLPAVDADQLAYVVFTSGSTGKPKGVLSTHRGAVSYLEFVRSAYGLTPADRVLQLPALTFDASVRDLFGPLSAGASVVLADPQQAKDPAALLGLIERHGVTALLSVVPSLLRLLLEAAPDDGRLRGALRTLLVSGERLFLADCRRAREVFGEELAVVNQYGPTECVMTSGYHRVTEGEGARADAPIGRPIANRRFYVLGRDFAAVPPGAVGDLYIGGEGLARGYLDRADLTAAAFLPDPFAAGDRMYATGDRVRHRPDGGLEFLGRADHQIKLRGVRIEPAEVEAALTAQPDVGQAVVVLREDGAAGEQLVAYLTPGDEPPGPETLRQRLLATLPEPMVPSDFVYLDALPLTHHGKVDRQALPAPGGTGRERLGGYLPPRDLVERQLVRLWEQLLGRSPVGVRDNFFELGGHSLLAVRLMARIEEQFGRALPLIELFRSGTIEDLAAVLQSQPGDALPSAAVPLRRTGSLPPFFCVHPAGGSVLCYENLSHHLEADRPFYGLQSRGVDSDETPFERVEDMAAWYIDAVRRIQPHGPYHLGGWSFGGLLAFEMAQQLLAAGEEVATLALFDTHAPGRRAGREVDDAFTLAYFAREGGLDVTADELRQLGPEERLARVAELAVEVNLLPRDTVLQSIRRMLGVYNANVQAAQEYMPRLAYPGRLTFLSASEPLDDETAALSAQDPSRGWSRHVAGPLDVHFVPGSHLTLIREPQVRGLAAALLRTLVDR
ncbi:MAG TPA: non-ribosomal peptide synthase/polyketide synthase [Thermoanaerobaculia bacterium]|nr:non-ribosomal peptide synthase/polyketide synthase [Thermoanaerobaculia bacterium]